MPRETDILTTEPQYHRGSVALGLRREYADDDKPRVDPEGGKYGAGIIRGASLIARGEALGHGEWIDDVFLMQVAHALNDAGHVKVRYTHPGLSGDGLGKVIAHAYRAEHCPDECTIADVHFTQKGRETPEGDLGGYVLDIAMESPEDFGISIVYEWDAKAEREHQNENQEVDDDGRSRFKSPDPKNEKNLPHARLAKLRASDFVGDPAANENGVFFGVGGSELPAELDAAISYAIGIISKPATCSALNNVNPDRARGFVQRYLDAHDLAIVEKSSMPKAKLQNVDDNKRTELSEDGDGDQGNTQTEKPDSGGGTGGGKIERTEGTKPSKPGSPGVGCSAGIDEYVEKYGQTGYEYFAKGFSFDEADHEHLQRENKSLREQLAAKAEKNEKLQQKLSAAGVADEGESEPIEGTASEQKKTNGNKFGIRAPRARAAAAN